LEFSGAGHPPAFLISSDGKSRRLDSRAVVLGCLPDAVPADVTQEAELRPGQRLVFYTDGFTEVFNQRGEILDISGLEEMARKAAGKPLSEMKRAILDGVEAWRFGPLRDDMSLLLVELV
jgi:sigma-B regulation protein RsbU (phosphoserine phosphatase)